MYCIVGQPHHRVKGHHTIIQHLTTPRPCSASRRIIVFKLFQKPSAMQQFLACILTTVILHALIRPVNLHCQFPKSGIFFNLSQVSCRHFANVLYLTQMHPRPPLLQPEHALVPWSVLVSIVGHGERLARPT